jgi:hypothetical protein
VARPSSLLLAVIMSAWLAGCATPTPYQPAAGGFGYAEQQIENHRYRVSFAGNSVTPRDVVQNYLLYRAAQLTLESHHDYFTVVNQDLERSTAYQGTGFDSFGFVPRNSANGFVGFGPSSYSAYPIDSYTAFGDIVMGDGEKPAGDLKAYDARDVLRRLGPTIVLPKESSS